jgi:hypothetical protein
MFDFLADLAARCGNESCLFSINYPFPSARRINCRPSLLLRGQHIRDPRHVEAYDHQIEAVTRPRLLGA